MGTLFICITMSFRTPPEKQAVVSWCDWIVKDQICVSGRVCVCVYVRAHTCVSALGFLKMIIQLLWFICVSIFLHLLPWLFEITFFFHLMKAKYSHGKYFFFNFKAIYWKILKNNFIFAMFSSSSDGCVHTR